MFAGVGAVGRIGRHGISGGAKRPSFSVDFISGGGSLGGGAVFTRASGGWYYNSSGVLVQAGVNVPRFDYDPVTLQPKGLLLEDASTNIALQSGNLANAAWLPFGATLPTMTANNVVAPDGTTTAARMVMAAVSGGGSCLVYQAPILTAAPYTFSMWLRGNTGGEQVYLSASTGGTTFVSSPRLILTTQWQRLSWAFTGTATTWAICIGTDLRDGSQTSTPAQTIYAWGAQVEALPYMSSHIPTTSVSVTRAADSLRYPVASVLGFSQTQGTLAHDYILEGSIPGFGTPAFFSDVTLVNDIIGLPESQLTGATGTSLSINAAELYKANGQVGYCLFTPNIATPAGPINRTATAWLLNGAVNGAHNATLSASNSGNVTALPVVTELRIADIMRASRVVSQWARRTRYWPRQLSQSELIAATQLDGPTLSLDFMQPGTLDPRITFTRASTAAHIDASGVIQMAAVNQPRWDYDPVTHALLGVLIEEQRTNIAFPSVPSVAGGWTSFGASTTPNSGIAPDNTNTMAKLTDDGANSIHCIAPAFTIAASQPYTVSVYAKAGEIRYLGLRLDNGISMGIGAVFDLQTGTVAAPAVGDGGGTVTSGTIQAVGNGIYRCVLSGNLATNILGRVALINMLAPAYGFPGYQSVAGNGCYVWGVQLEQGAFPTSYIPTTSASVTRAADVAVMPTNVSWYGSTVGTFAAEFIYVGSTVSLYPRILGDTATTNGLFLDPTQHFGSYDGGAVSVTTNAVSLGVISKGAGVIPTNAGASKSMLNGGPVASLSMTTGIGTSLAFRFMGDSISNTATGYIRRVTYWNRALSDTEMQTVTT